MLRRLLRPYCWLVTLTELGHETQARGADRRARPRLSQSGDVPSQVRALLILRQMTRTAPHQHLVIVLLAVAAVPGVRAAVIDPADRSIEQFLAQDPSQHAYRAMRRLEVQNGSRSAWLEAMTEYSPTMGFRYQVMTEGGSSYMRSKILRGVLDGEREVIALGKPGQSAIVRSNYTFESKGVDPEGLVNVLLSPRRKDRALVHGIMFLTPTEGVIVRLQGRLAKSPSFWVKNVDIIRRYERIDGTVVPVTLESTAQLRLLGSATLSMTYDYSEIDGRPVQD